MHIRRVFTTDRPLVSLAYEFLLTPDGLSTVSVDRLKRYGQSMLQHSGDDSSFPSDIYGKQILEECIKLQIALCEKEADPATSNPRKGILLISAICCCIIVAEMSKISAALGSIHGYKPDDDTEGLLLYRSKGEDEWCNDFDHLDRTTTQSGKLHKSQSAINLISLLEDICQQLLHLMLQRKPQHSPLILCTLLLLSVTTGDVGWFKYLFFRRCYGSNADDEPHRLLCNTIRKLTILFEVLFQHIPFKNTFDQDLFANSVGKDQALVACYSSINGIWRLGKIIAYLLERC